MKKIIIIVFITFVLPVLLSAQSETSIDSLILNGKQKIEDALYKYKTQRKAAKALGLTERILGYKIKNYKIKS